MIRFNSYQVYQFCFIWSMVWFDNNDCACLDADVEGNV